MSAQPAPKKSSLSAIKWAAAVVLVLIVGAAAFTLSVFHILPINIIEGWVDAAFKERTGLHLKHKTFERTFPLGLTAAGIEVRNEPTGAPMLVIDKAWAGVNPLGVITGRASADFQAALNGGIISGDVSFGIRKTVLSAKGKELNVNTLPILRRTGLNIDYPFDGVADITYLKGKCPEGEIMVKGQDIPEGNVKLHGIPLPFGKLDDAGLKARLSDCKMMIEALWFEGKDVSARAQGIINIRRPIDASPLELKLELIPKGKLLEKEFLLALLQKYRKSANYYQIDIKGTLGSPSAD